MSVYSRLDRLAPALTAQERALLCLAVLKGGQKAEDPLWRLSIPPDQVDAFNRYIDLINAANMRLATLVHLLEKEAEKLEVLTSTLLLLRAGQAQAERIGLLASLLIREPVTEGEHRLLAEEAAAEYIPVSDAAERVAAPDGDEGRAEARLRAAAAAGEIESQGRDAALRLRSGSVDAWLGKPPSTDAEWCADYDVRPDSEQASVDGDRQALGLLRRALEGVPGGELVDTMEQTLRATFALRWTEMRALEVVLDAIAAELGGEDPLKPATRRRLGSVRSLLEGTAAAFAPFGPEPERPEPGEEQLRELRAFVEGGRRLFALGWG